MSQQRINATCRRCSRKVRRGAVAVYVMVSMGFVFGFAALAIDIGMLYSAQAEMQRTADATAMAAAWELLDEDRLKGGAYLDYVLEATRSRAVEAAAGNPVQHVPTLVDPSEDVQIGYVFAPMYGADSMSFDDPELSNAVAVNVRRDSERGGSIALYFAQFLGVESRALQAEAIAAFADGTVGYEVTPETGNADLLPFTLHVSSWLGLVAGTTTTGDNYSFDPETGEVSAGSDGILELNLYPGAGYDQLPPGNFGTVDIGSPNNSSTDIARQILEGVSAEDLAYFGGTLELGLDGRLELNGDTGLSAGFKDELEEIKGQGRAIPIFTEVSGPGNNAVFTVVGFVGMRIVDVKFTGPISGKKLVIQPAIVVDDSVVVEPGPGPSYYVYRPVQLVH
jgi:hypothetical protein